MGDEVVSPRIRPTVDQNEVDTLDGNQDLPLPKRGLQGAGAGADVVASTPKGIKQSKAVSLDKGGLSLAWDKAATTNKYTIGILWVLMCKGWLFCCRIALLIVQPLMIIIMDIFGQGSIHLAPTMMHNTPMQILSVLFVVLCWTDIKFAFGQTDYGCEVLVDRVAGKMSSNSYMVAITLLASILIGAVGVASIRWIHSRRRIAMKVIDEALKDAPRVLRSDPYLVPPPAIEPWSDSE